MTDSRRTNELAPMLVGVSQAPSHLWVRGSLPSMPGVAIVGTRRCTEYGRTIARTLGHAVASAGWPVISGLARGIDAAAHTGTLDAGGEGFAVLGCGVDVIYPAENRGLAGRLLENAGGLISEYPPGTPPAPFRFPARNRIIAGLSGAVVVVEAAVTGGALITARLALDQGIDVLAVPGDINRATSEGCNLLIRDGAHPVLSSEDLIESLERILGPSPRPPLPIPVVAPGSLLDEVLEQSDRPVGAVLAEVVRAELAGRLKIKDGVVGS
ncbi:MAG TPA: DNA-processing protein DprA [Acidimicrobiia bacterium]|nr:DNA-processing protein DprA [Acidimicrobiia bacterium]